MNDDEFSIIDRYFKPLYRPAPGVNLGPGDDCALLAPAAGTEVCTTTDTLLEGVHFPPGAPGRVAAARALGANLSDLAAMGAEPWALLLSLTLAQVNHDWLDDFSGATGGLLEEYGVSLIGGNLAKGPLGISITAFGLTPTGQAIKRSGARPGQGIYVTGSIGDASAGLKLSLADDSSHPALRARYERPSPRLASGQGLRGLASAMIDVSDGLLADAAHLLEASGISGEIDLALVPLSPELQQAGVTDAAAVANQGDDYELCFTAPPSKAAAIGQLAEATGIAITRIGVTAAGSGLRLHRHGKPAALANGGYNHFLNSPQPKEKGR